MFTIYGECDRITIDAEFITGDETDTEIKQYQGDTVINTFRSDISSSQLGEIQRQITAQNFMLAKDKGGGRVYYAEYRRK